MTWSQSPPAFGHPLIFLMKGYELLHAGMLKKYFLVVLFAMWLIEMYYLQSTCMCSMKKSLIWSRVQNVALKQLLKTNYIFLNSKCRV